MNSAPQFATVEISDAELDSVSGGLHANLVVGPTAISDADVLTQINAVKSEVLGAAAQ